MKRRFFLLMFVSWVVHTLLIANSLWIGSLFPGNVVRFDWVLNQLSIAMQSDLRTGIVRRGPRETNVLFTPDRTRVADLYYGEGRLQLEVRTASDRRVFQESIGANMFISALAWSPDSTQLAMNVGDAEGGYLYRVTEAGEAGVLVRPENGRTIAEFRWSPNSRAIAYRVDRDVYVVDVASGAARRLTQMERLSAALSPKWSPDGHMLMVETRLRGDDGITACVLLIDMETEATTSPWCGGAPHNIGADWSPDGEMIVFRQSASGAGTQLFIMNRDGSGLRQLTYSDKNDYNPSWSADGRHILFSRSDEAIYTVDVNSGTLHRVARGCCARWDD